MRIETPAASGPGLTSSPASELLRGRWRKLELRIRLHGSVRRLVQAHAAPPTHGRWSMDGCGLNTRIRRDSGLAQHGRGWLSASLVARLFLLDQPEQREQTMFIPRRF